MFLQRVRHGILLVAGVTPLLVAAEARAGSRGTVLDFSVDVRDTYYAKMPTFTLSDPTSTPLRTVGAGTLPSVGPEHFLTFGFDCGLATDDRLLIPLLGMTLGGAIGSTPRVITSLDGTIAEMHPWTAFAITVLLPGIGVRAKERRWMFAASARPTVTAITMAYTLANGSASVDPDSRACAATSRSAAGSTR